MKLSTALVRQTLDQLQEQSDLEDIAVVPDDNPATPRLTSLFGDHTFFLDNAGLHIVEPTEAHTADMAEAQVIKLASWSNESHTALSPHRPEATDLIISLDSDEEA